MPNTYLSQTIRLSAVWLTTALLTGLVESRLDAQQPPPPRPDFVSQDEITQLNRGPVHEAFAQPYQPSVDQPYVIDREPPAPINEAPPQIVPTSENYQWINGYWGWEPEDNRFVWISGIWRKAPDELVWNPGYWAQGDRGYAWVSGFWGREEERYFPIAEAPPEPRQEEAGEAPSAEHFWVPGQYQYARSGYQWEPGYWARGYAGRVWVPAHYNWTPRGYIAVNGYWDYDLEDRGVLFSPVVFQDGYDRNIRYSPSVVVRVNYLPTHLFVDAPYRHYVYGDYYGVQRSGFYAWTSTRANFYDPLRVFFQIHAPDRFARYRDRHDYYHDHSDQRPRHSWKDQRDFAARSNADLRDSLISAEINTLVQQNSNNTQIRFEDNAQAWNDVVERSQENRARQQKRQEFAREQAKRFENDDNAYQQQREEYLRRLDQRQEAQNLDPRKLNSGDKLPADGAAAAPLREADRLRQELQQRSPQRDRTQSQDVNQRRQQMQQQAAEQAQKRAAQAQPGSPSPMPNPVKLNGNGPKPLKANNVPAANPPAAKAPKGDNGPGANPPNAGPPSSGSPAAAPSPGKGNRGAGQGGNAKGKGQGGGNAKGNGQGGKPSKGK